MAVCNCSLLEYNHGRMPTAGKDGRLESIARLNNSLMAGCRGLSVGALCRDLDLQRASKLGPLTRTDRQEYP